MKRTLLTLGVLLVTASTAPAQGLVNVSHDTPDPLASPLWTLSTTDSIAFASKVATGNLVGITITNYGFIGNNFISRDPSFEFPLGAGYEHMVRGGLWVGAQAIDDNGAFTGVVTGALDGSQGQATQGATEFTPAGRVINNRSSLENSEFFNRKAVSELDFLSDYSDRPAKRWRLR